MLPTFLQLPHLRKSDKFCCLLFRAWGFCEEEQPSRWCEKFCRKIKTFNVCWMDFRAKRVSLCVQRASFIMKYKTFIWMVMMIQWSLFCDNLYALLSTAELFFQVECLIYGLNFQIILSRSIPLLPPINFELLNWLCV